MDEKNFYERCSYLLGVEHEYRDPTPVPKMPDREGNVRNVYKNRYNGRLPGNGRFPGSGIVRNFGSLIQVRLTTPPLFGNFTSFDETLAAIEAAMQDYCEKILKVAYEEELAALKDNPVGYRIAGPEEIDLARRQLHRGNMTVISKMDGWRSDHD